MVVFESKNKVSTRSILKKTYLQPRHLRRGQPVIAFVTMEVSPGATYKSYWLGTYSYLKTRVDTRPYRGEARDYNDHHKVRITEDFYQAFLEESYGQHLKYGRLFPED